MTNPLFVKLIVTSRSFLKIPRLREDVEKKDKRSHKHCAFLIALVPNGNMCTFNRRMPRYLVQMNKLRRQ